MIEAIHKAVHGLLACTRCLSAIFLISSVAINFANIVGRYVFNASFTWAIEIILFLMVGAVFTGCCAVAGRTAISAWMCSCASCRRTSPRLLGLLSDLVLIATAMAVAAFSYPVIIQLAEFDERSAAANFPMVIPQAMVPIGYSLMAILVAVSCFTGRHHGNGAPSGTHS